MKIFHSVPNVSYISGNCSKKLRNRDSMTIETASSKRGQFLETVHEFDSPTVL